MICESSSVCSVTPIIIIIIIIIIITIIIIIIIILEQPSSVDVFILSVCLFHVNFHFPLVLWLRILWYHVSAYC